MRAASLLALCVVIGCGGSSPAPAAPLANTAPQRTPTDAGPGASTLGAIFFDENSSDLDFTAGAALDHLVDLLDRQTFERITVAGHAAMHEADPMHLATERAEVIREGLVSRGVRADLIELLDSVPPSLPRGDSTQDHQVEIALIKSSRQ